MIRVAAPQGTVAARIGVLPSRWPARVTSAAGVDPMGAVHGSSADGDGEAAREVVAGGAAEGGGAAAAATVAGTGAAAGAAHGAGAPAPGASSARAAAGSGDAGGAWSGLRGQRAPTTRPGGR